MGTDESNGREKAAENTLTVDEWLKVDLRERVIIIREGRVEFLSGGEPIATITALDAIKSASNLRIRVTAQS
jgi:hypothetical protein